MLVKINRPDEDSSATGSHAVVDQLTVLAQGIDGSLGDAEAFGGFLDSHWCA
jgi:hypothetical protein